MNCKNDLVILPYEKNMTWFISLLVASFYSQRMCHIMLEASKKWNRKNPIFHLFYFILRLKYNKSQRSGRSGMSGMSEEYFSKLTLENLMNEMYYYDENKFWFDTAIIDPMHAKYYIKNIFNFFGLSSLMVTVYADETVMYDQFNSITKIYDDKKTVNLKIDRIFPEEIRAQLSETPDILVVRLSDKEMKESPEFKNNPYKLDYYVTNIKNTAEFLLHDNVLQFNGAKYELDSVLLDNISHNPSNHTITGITCHNEKYIYNGWKLKNENDAMVPCDLMEYDWNTNVNKKFCLKEIFCGIHTDNLPEHSPYCFSAGSGERILIYTKTGNIGKYMNNDMIDTHSPSPTSLMRFKNKHSPQGKHSASKYASSRHDIFQPKKVNKNYPIFNKTYPNFQTFEKDLSPVGEHDE